MRFLLVTTFLLLFISSYGQRIISNLYDEDFDDPPKNEAVLKTTAYRYIESYTGNDSTFSTLGFPCTTLAQYNDSGELIKLIKGRDIHKNQIDYIISYSKVNDTICDSKIEISPNYLDSLHLFQIDTVINGTRQFKDIYKREKNGTILIKCRMKFRDDEDYAREIYRYDKNGIIKEISFPLGNMKELEVINSIDSSLFMQKRLQLKQYKYETNSITHFTELSAKKILLYSGYLEQTIDRNPDIHISNYIYDKTGKVIFKIETDENNKLLKLESFAYNKDKLKSYILDYDPSDTIINESRLYNNSGQIIKWTKNSIGSPIGEQSWIFYYTNNLLMRQDIFLNNQHYRTTKYLFR